VLVNCAFSFCWDAWFADHPPHHDVAAPQPEPGGGERGAARRHAGPAAVVLAPGDQGRPSLASPWIALQRWWAAWSNAPPPRQLQELLDSVGAGHGLHLYARN